MLLSYPTFVESKSKQRGLVQLLDVMKIQLPDFVIADLYKNSLVITDEVHPAHTFMPADDPSDPSQTEETEVPPALYLGGNEKGIAVLVSNAQNRFLDDESLQLLTNILSAFTLTMNDIALFNIQQTPFSYKDIIAQFGAKTYLLFGVSTQQVELPFQMPDYKVQTFDNCKFLCSASLEKMKGSEQTAKLEKTKLWMCLKSLFE